MLKLDDAVTVLRNLTQTASMNAPQLSMKDFQAFLDRIIRSLIGTEGIVGSISIFDRLPDGNLRHGLKKDNRTGLPPSRGNASRGGRKQQLSSEHLILNLCYDCGEHSHY